jgi:hypothetical protein
LAPPERKLDLPAQQEPNLEQDMQRLVDTGRMAPGVMRSIYGAAARRTSLTDEEELALFGIAPRPPAFDEPAGECRKSAESAAKPRLELVPYDCIEEIAEVLTYGANKYEANNWTRGARWGRYFAALLRHAFAWWRGEDKDPETGFSHLAHVGCNLVFLMSYQRHGWGTDDRFLGPDEKPFTKHDGVA